MTFPGSVNAVGTGNVEIVAEEPCSRNEFRYIWIYLDIFRHYLIFSVVGRIERCRAHHAVYHSSKCEGAVSEWRDQRASRLPCPTSMTSSRIAMFAHRVANNFTS